MQINRWLPFLLAACAVSSEAAYYDTLPKGVRTLVYHYVTTSKINSEFSGSKNESDYHFVVDLGGENLSSISAVSGDIFNYLQAVSPEAYDQFSFGEYEIDGHGKVNVNAMGIGIGLTHSTTLYTAVPLYSSNVTLDIKRTKGNNHQAVAQSLQASGNSAEAQVFADIARQLPDASGEILQSVMVNYFGYKPIGDWSAQGLGDIELGVIQRLTNWHRAGLAVTAGVVLPTGREDDPDIIQDIPFGDGQTDVFAEFGGGYTVPNYLVSFDSFIRYTYQMPTTKTLRIADNKDYPQLATEKGEFSEKLGNKYDFTFASTYHLRDWFDLQAAYLYNFREQSKYESPYSRANLILSENTMEESHTAKFGLGFSSVNSFKRGDFMLPFNASLSAQQVLVGRNTPKYTRLDFEIRFFF
jgi:hypothetical protein